MMDGSTTPAATGKTMRGTPVVLGVLSIIFGGLMTLYSLGSIAMMSLATGMVDAISKSVESAPDFQRQAAHDPQLGRIFDVLPKMMEVSRTWGIWLLVDVGVPAVVLLVIGIGLAKRRAWSRQAALAWCGLAFVAIAIRITLMHLMTVRMLDLLGDLPLGNAPFSVALQIKALTGEMTILSAVMTIVWLGAFPTVLAILLGRPSAKNDFPPA